MNRTTIVSRYWRVILLVLTLVLSLFIFLWPSQLPPLPSILNNGLVYSNKFESAEQSQLLSDDRNGAPASALLLDGIDDYVLIEDSSINLKNDFSFCLWAKPLPSNKEQVIFLKGENCPDGSPHFVGISFEVRMLASGHLRTTIVAQGGTHMSEYLVVESEKAVPKSKWTFVSIDYSNSTKSFNLTFNEQVQGVKLSSRTGPENFTEIHQSNSPLKLGAAESYCGYIHEFSNYYNGFLDDLYIFDRQLSSMELRVLSGNQASYGFWEEKSIPIIISVILLVLATNLIWSIKTGNNVLVLIKNLIIKGTNKFDFEDVMIFFTISFGVFLAVAQYASNRSLWLDEIFVAMNIISRNPFQLLQPLDYYQVAPILFLQVEKLFSVLIPDTDLAVRTFPLMAFLASLYLVYRILATIHVNKYAVLVGLALFTFNSPLIYYASEAKQYMIDVLGASLIYFLLLKDYKNDQSKFAYLGIVGTVFIFLTNVAAIILFTAGVFLVFQHNVKDSKVKLSLMKIFGAWSIVFGIYYFFFIWHHPTTGPMLNYWSQMDAFAPANIFSREFYNFILNKWASVRGRLFQFGPVGETLLNILGAIGILSLLLRRKVGYLVLICLPVFLHLLLSGLKMYPLDVRLILYLSPSFVMLFSFGLKELIELLFADLKIERIRFLSFAIPVWFATLFYSSGFYWESFPFKKDDTKQSIIYLRENWQPGDKVYLLPAAILMYNYYKEVKDLKISAENIVLGRHVGTIEEDAGEISTLHGRVWIIPGGEGDAIITKLEELGYVVEDAFWIPPPNPTAAGTGAFLFHFK